ncbi:MAG: ABC-type Na+ efflux pump, ATPase component [uncultured bacterium]|nr:MAG: ABC-type Na+ efflux pump, ATPase component [uncultured bacterium]
MPLITINNLSFSYGREEILKDINWQIASNQCWHLKGFNGCGKSTLLKVLCSLLIPQKGTIQKSFSDNPSLYSPEIGLYQDLTIEQNMSFFSQLREIDQEFAQKLSHELDIQSLKKKVFRQLSHGQRFRVQLYQSLIINTPLYLLDEPLEGLDVSQLAHIYQALHSLKQKGKTWVVVSHMVPKELDALLTHRAHMDAGLLHL